MAAPVLLLVNPSAGGGKAGRALPAVLAELQRQGLEVRSELTRDLAHARELARTAALAGETVVCLSGDGMVGAVADGLREVPGALLGVLPGGRGNDLARVLGIGQDPVSACAIVANGVARKLDLGEVSGTAFVGIASVGFDSEANRIANQAPARLGNLVYLYGALRALAQWRPVRFEIELTHSGTPSGAQVGDPPGERHAFTGYTVGACNSRSYGGGMQAAPDALLDDGLLDVIVLEDVSKLRFLARILPKVFSGRHMQEPSVKAFRAREVAIWADRPLTLYADGDPIAELPARVRAVPAAISVLVPAGDPPSPAFASAGAAAGGDAGPAAAGTTR
ncbi:MAG TPA: diacylglycerol kinase family protein [Solirubrobacteraceae bacterium]|jgi:YegS/Rv2252/BmrU family lipid kinase|nr:diacylglycerol kinase family protein [Solirubrobacteraceae bacterium]